MRRNKVKGKSCDSEAKGLTCFVSVGTIPMPEIQGKNEKEPIFFFNYYSLKEKNQAYLSQRCPGWKNRQEPQIPDQALFHTMPPEWKEPRRGRDSPLSGTSPDVCAQTGLASQDVRAANCCSRYWVFTHSQPGCFALQVIKQGNGADAYEPDPCAVAPRFCISTSARIAWSINRALYSCSPSLRLTKP